ncbi:MAG: hypothetical protein H7Z14_08770 [Anaerolineae bacterium]|nr:hypothetical protein [Phycisphaerae bacterium]
MSIVTAHAFAAAVWMIFMPGGFAIGHPRFWTNRVGPMLVLLIAIGVLLARVMKRPQLAQHLVLIFPLAWLGAAISGIIVFPISARLIAPLAVAGALVMAWSLRPFPPRSLKRIAMAILALAIGAIFPPLERAGNPRTTPIEIELPSPPADSIVTDYIQGVQLRSNLGVHTSSGQVVWGVGRAQVQVAPLLTFISRSPDRSWTILSPRDQRRGPERRIVALERAERETLRAWYADDDVSMLAVDATARERIELDAMSRLPQAVFSHLNSYCEIAIVGHRKLRISFSPCDDAKVDVKYSDYPIGAPIRFAYFDAATNRLRIVEATNAEKGPFHDLASGPLTRGDPLTITLFDNESALCSITLRDWSAQASDEISPTAGWGVPANSIAFSLADRSDRSPAAILISLADTGVGRGYDTVGHAAGAYRNRMTLTPLLGREGLGEGRSSSP